MKNLLVFCLLPLTLTAQSSGKERFHLNQLYLNAYNWELKALHRIHYSTDCVVTKEQGVRSVTGFSAGKNQKLKHVSTTVYNEQGLLLSRCTAKDTTVFAYRDTLLVSIDRRNRRNHRITTIGYDGESRVVSMQIEKNGKLERSCTAAYFDGEKRTYTEERTFGRRGHVYRLEHDYDTLPGRISGSRYLIDGKVKRTWNYECSEQGKMNPPKTEELSSSCRYEQVNNDGSYSVFNRQLRDGKFSLIEATYSRDSVLISYRRYSNDTLLVYEQVTTGNITETKYFSEKGRLRRSGKSVKNDFGHQIEYTSFNRRGKETYHSKTEFNDHNLPVSVNSTSGSHYRFEYTFF